ncbi:Oidioi.mRNA.OKI2018_I69.XSR.g13541.t1.cds [Oikopleura dioica]|uniref:Oidioi.mRNA.OKI2018_I69.XSR.g13541.t1.cds n=1 Tax=Oikopleura dioica TaxID=34765 RepID=A0ABN7S762_OIKDI|nr:Oidioi.mRNA.OKI2018_I69.XSR.g13541.t1.cds [Oikopleura dioica]
MRVSVLLTALCCSISTAQKRRSKKGLLSDKEDSGECSIEASKRVECGWPGIEKWICEARGCCFDSSGAKGDIWCFAKETSDSSQCGRADFRCVKDGKCVKRDAVCDGYYDCLDGSDELQCGWAAWTGWTRCSRTCGNGLRLRERACRGHQKLCSGRNREQEECFAGACVDTVAGERDADVLNAQIKALQAEIGALESHVKETEMKNEELRIEMELFEEMNDSSVCDQLNNLRKQLDNILERRLKKYRGNSGIQIKLKSTSTAESQETDAESTFIEKTTSWKPHPTRAPKGSIEEVQWKDKAQNNTSFARVAVTRTQKRQRTQRKQAKGPILIESPNEVRTFLMDLDVTIKSNQISDPIRYLRDETYERLRLRLGENTRIMGPDVNRLRENLFELQFLVYTTEPKFDQLELRKVTREIFQQMEWVNWRENTIQILASIKEEDKNQTKIKLNKEETDDQTILLEAELLTPPDVILKQAVAEEFTEWEQWSKCSCSEKRPMKSRSRECLTDPCSEFLLSESSYDCVEECQELLNRISLDGHNERRRRHVDTPDLVYDPSLCADAQRHANLLASTETFEHDQTLGQKGLGENLYQVTPIRRSENGVWYTVPSKADEHYENAVKNWYNERTRYFYQMAMFTPMTGHFTQIVWKSTTAVCMAHAYSDEDNLYIVARYSEGGNTVGEFRENVLPLKSNEAYAQDECERIPASVLAPHLPAHWSCEEFIQCDEQRVPFIKTCAPGTAWRAYYENYDYNHVYYNHNYDFDNYFNYDYYDFNDYNGYNDYDNNVDYNNYNYDYNGYDHYDYDYYDNNYKTPWFWNMNPFKSTTQRPTITTASTEPPTTITTTQGSLGWLWNMNPFRPTTQRTTTTTRAYPTPCTCSSNGRNLRENESAIFEMSANCRQTRTCGSGCILRTSTPICNVQPSPSNSYINRVNSNCQCGWKGQQFSGLIPSDKVCYWLRCTSYLGYCQAQTVVSCVHPDTKKIGPYWPDKNRPAPTEHPSWSAWEVAFVNGEPMRQREEVGQAVQAVNPYKQKIQKEDCSVWRGCLPRPECMSNYVRCIGTN